MFNLFNRQPKITSFFKASQEYTDITVFFFDTLKTKQEDRDRMAYIKTPFYHGYGKLSDKQFQALSQDFIFQELEFTNKPVPLEELMQHELAIHKTYKQAKDENYRLNLAYIYTFYCPLTVGIKLSDDDKEDFLNFELKNRSAYYDEQFSLATEEEKKEFLTKNAFFKDVKNNFFTRKKLISIQNTLEALKTNPVLELAYNDYNEILFRHAKEFSHRDPDHFVFIPCNFDTRIKDAKSFKELVEKILSIHNQKVSPSFKKQMINFIIKNLYKSAREKGERDTTIYSLNQDLINEFIFLSEYIDFSKYSWNQIENLVKAFAEKIYNFDDSLFFPVTKFTGEDDSANYHAFKKHMSFLKKQGFDLVDVLSHWNLYTSTMRNSAPLLEEIDFQLDTNRYKDLNRVFNFIGRKLSEKSENFDFSNPNHEELSSDTTTLASLEIQGYQIKLVKDFKELLAIGSLLDNCAGSKATISSYKDKINYVLVKNGKIEYLGGIKSGKFDQLKGYKNASPSFELFKEVFNKLHELKFIHELDKQVLKKHYMKQVNGDKWRALYEGECVQH